jgi:hypothetical protein
VDKASSWKVMSPKDAWSNILQRWVGRPECAFASVAACTTSLASCVCLASSCLTSVISTCEHRNTESTKTWRFLWGYASTNHNKKDMFWGMMFWCQICWLFDCLMHKSTYVFLHFFLYIQIITKCIHMHIHPLNGGGSGGRSPKAAQVFTDMESIRIRGRHFRCVLTTYWKTQATNKNNTRTQHIKSNKWKTAWKSM